MEHGFISPSKLYLRYKCPGSVEMDQLSSEECRTKASDEGVQKHEIMKKIVDSNFSLESIVDDEHIRFCVESVRPYVQNADSVYTEIQVIPKDLGITGGWVIDLLIIKDNRAIIFDYKFGIPKYESLEYQLNGYAEAVRDKFKVKWVEMYVLIPVMKKVLRVKDIFDFKGIIKDIIQKCEEKPLVKITGEHCTYCKGFTSCNALKSSLTLVEGDFKKSFQSMKRYEKEDILDRLYLSKQIIERLLDEATEVLSNSNISLDRYKIVTSSRYVYKEGDVLHKLKELCNIKDMDFNEVVEPISPSKAYKLFGEEINDMVEVRKTQPYLKKRIDLN